MSRQWLPRYLLHTSFHIRPLIIWCTQYGGVGVDELMTHPLICLVCYRSGRHIAFSHFPSPCHIASSHFPSPFTNTKNTRPISPSIRLSCPLYSARGRRRRTRRTRRRQRRRRRRTNLLYLSPKGQDVRIRSYAILFRICPVRTKYLRIHICHVLTLMEFEVDTHRHIVFVTILITTIGRR